MLVKPPLPNQPQEKAENAPTIDVLPLVENGIVENNDAEGIKDLTTKPITTIQPIIRKKRAYKMFLKLIKQGKYTNAMITSKLIGVDRQTIQSWLDTPTVQKCMNTEIDSYISKIQASKDWKAQAYLLDKATHEDKSQERADLQQLIVINT